MNEKFFFAWIWPLWRVTPYRPCMSCRNTASARKLEFAHLHVWTNEYLKVACSIWFACFHHGFRLFARVMFKVIFCLPTFLSGMQSKVLSHFWDACQHFTTEELLMQVFFWTYQFGILTRSEDILWWREVIFRLHRRVGSCSSVVEYLHISLS